MAELARELVETLVRLRAGVAEEHLARREVPDDLLRQPALRLVVVKVRDVNHPLRLFDERLGDLRVRMTERADRDAAAEVEVTLAVHVPEVTPLPAREHELEAPVAGHDVFLEQAEDGLLLVVNDGGRGRDDLFHSHGDLAAKGRKGHREKLP